MLFTNLDPFLINIYYIFEGRKKYFLQKTLEQVLSHSLWKKKDGETIMLVRIKEYTIKNKINHPYPISRVKTLIKYFCSELTLLTTYYVLSTYVINRKSLRTLNMR